MGSLNVSATGRLFLCLKTECDFETYGIGKEGRVNTALTIVWIYHSRPKVSMIVYRRSAH